MGLGFVFNYEADAATAGQLFPARLLGVEMIKTRFTRNYFSVFRQFQSFSI